MKKSAILVLAVLLLALPAGATPPKKVSLTFNGETQTLTVIADHYTLDPNFHFIKTIVVEVDGVQATTKVMTSQTDKNQQVVEIPLAGVKTGAKIKATCYCSLFGSGSAEIVAP